MDITLRNQHEVSVVFSANDGRLMLGYRYVATILVRTIDYQGCVLNTVVSRDFKGRLCDILFIVQQPDTYVIIVFLNCIA